jgi:hypothetical protein
MPIIDLVDHRDTVVSSAPPLLEYPLFPVATHKFIVLSLCSFGLYQFYWIYQNRKRLKRASGERSIPQSVAESGNRSYGAANVVWILVGGLLLILSVIGTFMPPE